MLFCNKQKKRNLRKYNPCMKTKNPSRPFRHINLPSDINTHIKLSFKWYLSRSYIFSAFSNAQCSSLKSTSLETASISFLRYVYHRIHRRKYVPGMCFDFFLIIDNFDLDSLKKMLYTAYAVLANSNE